MSHCSNCGKYLEDCAGVWVHYGTLSRRCFLGKFNGKNYWSEDVAEECTLGDMSDDEWAKSIDSAGTEMGLW